MAGHRLVEQWKDAGESRIPLVADWLLRCVHLHVQATSRASRDASTTVPSSPRPSLVQRSHPRATSRRYHSQPLPLCIGKQPSQQTRLALRISDCVRSSDKQHMVWLTDALTAHAHTLFLSMLSFGSCQMGDFVIGYGKCVRVQSLGSSTPPPNDVGGFDIASAGYYEDGTTRILRFTRPYENSIPGHVSICTDGEPNCTPPEQYSILCVPPFMALFVCLFLFLVR